jgi:hypothetical protein
VSLPTLTALRRRSAWFTRAQVNVLPSNTAVGHTTIATGTDPGVHGITGVSTYDWQGRRRHDMYAGCDPKDLLAPTIADVWQRATAGRAVILAQGSIDRAATPLAGHGACLANGTPVVLASYDQQTGAWHSNPDCFRLPDYLKDMNASTLWKDSPEWMSHRIDSTAAVRYSALFPKFESDATVAMIEHEPLGVDSVTDLILLNYKCADFVGHKYGPESEEMRVTLAGIDREVARTLGALETKVGKNYLLAVTADHGMPSLPTAPDHRHLTTSVADLLEGKFDPDGRQLVTSFEPENCQIYIDEDRLSKLGLTLGVVARFLESQPYMFAVFTNDEVAREANVRKRAIPAAHGE